MIQSTSVSSETAGMQILQFTTWNVYPIYQRICILLLLLYDNIICWTLFKSLSIDASAITLIIACYFIDLLMQSAHCTEYIKTQKFLIFASYLVSLLISVNWQHNQNKMEYKPRQLLIVIGVIKEIDMITIIVAAVSEIVHAGNCAGCILGNVNVLLCNSMQITVNDH